MEVRKGYKQTQVGVIPEDWVVKPLRKISPSQSVGLVINPSTYFDDNGTIPMLVGSNISENHIDWMSASRITIAGNKLIPASQLTANDLVTVRVGDPGTTAVVPPELDGCNCASMMIVRKHSSFDSQWLCYVMNSRIGLEQIRNVQYGTAQKQFNISDAINFIYPVPPLKEQQAIAAALSDVDTLLTSLDALIAKKHLIKQGAMQELLSGKKRLPGFSRGWKKCLLSDIGTFSKGRGIKKDEVILDGIPCIRYGEIYTHYNDYIKEFVSFISRDTAKKSQLIKRGDLLLTGSGETADGIGKCVAFLGDEEAYAGGDIVIFTPINQNSMYLGYLMNHSSIVAQKARMAQGDAIVHISAQKLGQLQLSLPDINEQTAIAEILSDMDAEIVALEQRREKTRLLKQGMMQELLTGKTRLI